MTEKATVTNQSMQAAFVQGFQEGLTQAGEDLYVLEIFFEDTQLVHIETPDLSDVLSRMHKALAEYGRGTKVIISRVGAEPAVLAPADDDVIDVEVIEET